MSDGVAAGQELIPLLSVPLLCRAPASPWGCPALSSAAVQDGTVLLTGRQPLSLPIKILHRGVLPCPSSWPGCSAVEAAAVPRLASRDHIPAPKQPRASPAQPLTDRAILGSTVTQQIRLPVPHSLQDFLTFHQSSSATAVPAPAPGWVSMTSRLWGKSSSGHTPRHCMSTGVVSTRYSLGSLFPSSPA